MAPSVVQSALTQLDGAGGTNPSISTAFGSSVTAGNLLLAFLQVDNLSQTPTISDTQTNVWSVVRGPDTQHSSNGISEIWWAKAKSSGANTVTVAGLHPSSGQDYPFLAVVEISAANTASPIEASAFASILSGSNTALDSGGITATAGNLLLGWGGSTFTTVTTYTTSGGWSILRQLNETGTGGGSIDHSSMLQSQAVSSTGTFHSTATSNKNIDWMMSIVSIKASLGTDIQHNVDAYTVGDTNRNHSVDAFISTLSYIKLGGNIEAPITPPNFVRFRSTVSQPSLSFVNLAGTIKSTSESFVQLSGTIQNKTRSFVRLAGSIQNPTQRSHSVDAVVSTQNLSFVQLAGAIQGKIGPGPCGSFPDASFVNLRGWIVTPGDSIQMPNSGFTFADDFLSSQVALASYKAMSVFILAKIALIVTAFTTGVQSWQTRTKSWLRRVDAASSGVLVTQKVNTHTLPNGAIITTTTKVTQQQDVTVTTITIQNSATPQRTSVIVTEKNKYGQTTSRETETVNINGTITQQETKTVFSQPPTTENIQPLKVTTLDGVQHYQFFNQVNNEWAGGDAEGVTLTNRTQQIIPATLNGQTVDQFGHPILAKITEEKIQTPDGKTIDTKTTLVGTRDAGTTTTDATENFNGIQTTTHTVVTYPDGSQTVTDKTTNNTTGDSTEVSVENVTDEYGQVTITTTTTETKTFVDPTTGNVRTTITKTIVVNKGGVITTDNQVDTTTDFEDDIYQQKVQVFYIQEFTINVVIDEFSMFALWEVNETHQKNFALLELFAQQLSNLNLSYKLRQNLITQYNTANSCVSPVTLQANGRTYQVVFAPSASAFRAKYIPGTEPHVYELQMILQERSNLITGSKGFF